jgi:A/G-specific adenine glycosylase
MKNKKQFRELLLRWNRKENKRSMPWKGEKDAYKVWLSEIILQQTRVEQGRDYYERFIQQYPTISALANAKDEETFKLWEGLGYYSRCKNLLHTARTVNETYAGNFPEDYDSILKLKGIGAYTASAIASFCFDLPYAVVDGNVLRVLSRYFGIDLPIDSTEGKHFFSRLAQECLDKTQPGEYNQSIMDFGATVCKPVALCDQCLMKTTCFAFNTGNVSVLPVKQKNIVKKERWFSYFIFTLDHKKFVQQRTAKDIWQNLHEFYLQETTVNPEWDVQKVSNWLKARFNIEKAKSIYIIAAKKQTLTHQFLHGYFICVDLLNIPEKLRQLNGLWLTDDEIKQKAFPRFIHQFTRKKAIQVQAL